jgi:choline dehydrogenase-like flavoprotein
MVDGGRFGKRRGQTLALMLPPVLGLTDADAMLIPHAVARMDEFVRSLSRSNADQIRVLFDGVNWLSVSLFARFPYALEEDELNEYVQRLFDPEDHWPHNVLGILRRAFGESIPSVLDIARALKEACALAWYGLPDTHAHTEFVPLWENLRVLDLHPDSATARPYSSEDRRRPDPERILAARAHSTQERGFFREDGRPKVAIIGAGPAGSIVAAELAATCDVAVFEAGPELKPLDFPVDPMAAMSLVYERSLLYPSRDLDLRILQARVVGGGSAVNEGVAVRPRSSTLDHWARHGASLDRSLLDEGLAIAEKRQRFAPYSRDLLTSAAERMELGAARSGLAVDLLHSDIATHVEQHADGLPDVIGSRCLACGYCNHGCRFGHHLSVDRTFLADARAAGAKLWANTPVSHVVMKGSRDRVTGIRLGRKPNDTYVECDAVVMGAGALGSAPLLVRSLAHCGPLRALPTVKSGNIGGGLGFNYGTPVFARWADGLPRAGYDGLQVGFIATKPGDSTFILENGFLPPGVFASVVPGWGEEHHSWMGDYGRFGMCVNTIGGHSDGSIDGEGQINYRVGPDAMGTIHESLAAMVDMYLHADADEVALSGLVRTAGEPTSFGQDLRGKSVEILDRVRHIAPTAEHLSLGSGHPQGGLRMDKDPEQGAVDEGYRLHGMKNLFVADASLFPTTLTVNVQWLVMGLAWTAAQAIRQQISR